KESQRNWIGKSKGTYIEFKLKDQIEKIDLEQKKDHLQTHAHLHRRARETAANPTPAESTLWKYVKDRCLGQLFKQQVVIGEFIVNFLCPSRKIVVDIDKNGIVQNDDYLEKRTRILEDMGYKVLRFRESDVTQNIGKVLET